MAAFSTTTIITTAQISTPHHDDHHDRPRLQRPAPDTYTTRSQRTHALPATTHGWLVLGAIAPETNQPSAPPNEPPSESPNEVTRRASRHARAVRPGARP